MFHENATNHVRTVSVLLNHPWIKLPACLIAAFRLSWSNKRVRPMVGWISPMNSLWHAGHSNWAGAESKRCTLLGFLTNSRSSVHPVARCSILLLAMS